MNVVFSIAIAGLLGVLALAAYIDRIYFEMGKFLSREYTENIDAWERHVEPYLKLTRESSALSASVLRQITLLALAFLLAMRLHPAAERTPMTIAESVFELLLVLVVFDRLVPQAFFLRTRGEWVARIRWLVQALFYMALPVTLTISLLLSIAALAEPEAQQEETPAEAVDALLEAGEEEGVFDQADRALVRSVVEFGDKIVREVMTPRPQIFAVPGTMTLEQFTAAVNEHGFSRVPVYGASLDQITGIAFARDLLLIQDADARTRRVSQLQRPAAFVPETKKVSELLREMQREKQHMSLVIDEYGGVAGLVTIEDLLETIVGDIQDEHDTGGADAPVAEPDGSWVVPGAFEVVRLRELFADRPAGHAPPEAVDYEGEPADDRGGSEQTVAEMLAPQLTKYEATTVGGMVSEIAGHIPLRGEVVEDGPLRLEVMASTDRTVERVRVQVSAADAAE